MEITIIKRDGNRVPFDISRIKKVIEWACEGYKVNSLELESKTHVSIKENMSTSEIQETLINTALRMTNLDDFNHLEWRFVAAKLLLLNMYKQSKRQHNYDEFGYSSYYAFVKKATEDGFYDSKILDNYTKEEIEEIELERKMEYDFGYDYAGMNLFKNRYLIKNRGQIYELPQNMYLSISLLLALAEEKEDRLDIAKRIYHAIASRKISLATPILLNLRRVGGNLASCFITAMDDSLDNIYYTLDQVAQISKNAGGVGVNMSRIRSQGAYIKQYKGASGGILPWIKLLNDTAVAVDQLGSRSGAVTVAIDVWHRDIEEFLEMQKENGDQRKKSYDVFPQIVVSDFFMRCVEENKKWYLIDPHEIRKKYNVELAELYGTKFDEIYNRIILDNTIEFKKEIDARSLFKNFLKTVVETGMPYVFYKDNANNVNPNKHSGMIGNANLCVESFSNFSPTKLKPKTISEDGTKVLQDIDAGYVHTCNLVSLNLALFDDDDTIEYMSKLSVRILDNTIEMSSAPIPETNKHNNDYRILGIGCMGLADYLVKRNLQYENSLSEVDSLYEKIARAGIEASADLAEMRGTYKFYEGSEWSKGIFFGKNEEWFKVNSKDYDKWKVVFDKVREQGMRNGGLFAIAPNTSTSLLNGVTASVLPIYKKFFIDKASNGVVPICPPFLNKKTFWMYKENQHTDQQSVIDVVSAIQKWTDQGISMELLLNLNKGVNAKEIYDMYLSAWKKGCKTVYYIRSITKNANESLEEKGCVSCAN